MTDNDPYEYCVPVHELFCPACGSMFVKDGSIIIAQMAPEAEDFDVDAQVTAIKRRPTFYWPRRWYIRCPQYHYWSIKNGYNFRGVGAAIQLGELYLDA